MVGPLDVAAVTDKPLYRHSIIIHVPLWLFQGTMDWMLLDNRYLHPVRMETTTYPLTYRIKLGTPAWSASLCRSVAEGASDIPKAHRRGQMIQHQTSSRIEDQLWVQGETRVDGAPIIRSDIEFIPTPTGEVRCDMYGQALQPKYRGLLAGAAKHMQQMVVAEQRAVEARARTLAVSVLIALRLTEPVLGNWLAGRQ